MEGKYGTILLISLHLNRSPCLLSYGLRPITYCRTNLKKYKFLGRPVIWDESPLIVLLMFDYLSSGW